MRVLRQAWGTSIGLPATRWMLELGAVLLRTETELILKSRRVVPQRLLEAGFKFNFADWPDAASDLVNRWRSNQAPCMKQPIWMRVPPAAGVPCFFRLMLRQ
ncbi:MAG: DUF1731 domain-containing protein [Acidobacteriia bacterium]|nr:DUF1731 domain-containing protein [Terriglobia bacterium]